MFSTISRLRRRNSDDNERGTSDSLLDNHTNPRPVRSTGYLNDICIILCSSYINILLVFLPFALISGARGSSANVVFTTNFLALMPLASLLSFSTEKLSKKMGQGIGGLLNVTFGNVTELIVGIVALRARQVKLIQTTMLGSILSSLLFVLGATFIVGGMQTLDFTFSSMIAQTMSSFMFVATGALVLPSVFDAALPHNGSLEAETLALSRGAAVVLLIIYICFLVYQLRTHAYVFETTGLYDDDTAAVALSPWIIAITLLIVTIIVSFCSDYLVGSIDEVVQSLGISKTFIGLILVPMVGNAVEAITCVALGYKLKMDLAIAITLGSCMQIALFLIPFLVILGWILDVPLGLSEYAIDFIVNCTDFEIFQGMVLFVSVTFTEYLINNGNSNWMEGSLLLGVYAIVAISYLFYPDLNI